jgi:hypothetical protein
MVLDVMVLDVMVLDVMVLDVMVLDTTDNPKHSCGLSPAFFHWVYFFTRSTR